jgi:transcriptional regulator with XRE-family HTH domain
MKQNKYNNPMPPKTKIGKNLKKLRKEKQLTQVELAEKAKISSNYYARIERDEENPSLEVLKDIAKALKVKSSEILDF